MGSVRPVDYGVVHAIPLGATGAELLIDAEDPPPPAADRLWETAHPAELSYIIASSSSQATQSFQSVSVDMRGCTASAWTTPRRYAVPKHKPIRTHCYEPRPAGWSPASSPAEPCPTYSAPTASRLP
jgi:hypothetical protein